MNGNRHKVFWGALSLALLLSFPGLFQRWSVEEATHTVGLVAAYRDVAALADQEGIEDEEALGLLQEAGLTGLMVGDLTGKELSNGALPLWFGPKNGLPSTWSGALEGDSDGAVVWVRQGDLDVDLVRRHVVARFGDVPFYEGEEGALFLLPLSLSALEEAAVLPDFEGLALSKELALPILFRPAPSHGLDGSAAMAALGAVLDENAQVRALAPSGPVVTAYPNVELLAEVVRERKLPLAKVEFSRQVGAIPWSGAFFPPFCPSTASRPRRSRAVALTVVRSSSGWFAPPGSVPSASSSCVPSPIRDRRRWRPSAPICSPSRGEWAVTGPVWAGPNRSPSGRPVCPMPWRWPSSSSSRRWFSSGG